MAYHKNIRSKMIKTRILLKHPLLSKHVPETLWYNPVNLEHMLSLYDILYIKPNTGCQGNDVIRLQKGRGPDCLLSYNNTSKELSLPDAVEELGPMTARRRFILQQGIDLATYENCPFDIRMVMMKTYNTWGLTLTSAKVALREDAVVTNVSKGAQDYPLHEILQKYDQKKDPLVAVRDLVNLAHQISRILGSKLPLRVIGLDMAIDKKGWVWFLEANTLPQCARCLLVNDEYSQKKFQEAKAIIRSRFKP